MAPETAALRDTPGHHTFVADLESEQLFENGGGGGQNKAQQVQTSGSITTVQVTASLSS